jgi:hypothetical protein
MTLGELYVLLLRLIHIGGGVFWAGAGIFMGRFLAPAVKKAGPDGGKVMGNLILDTGYSGAIASAAGLTSLSGILLYIRDTSAFGGEWTGTPMGIALAIGGLLGIIATIHGGAIIARGGTRIAKLGREIALAGGPPDQAKLSEMGQLQANQERQVNISVTLLVITVILMATARYLTPLFGG